MLHDDLTFLKAKADETNVYIILLLIGPALQNEEETSELRSYLNSHQQLLEEQFNEEGEPLSALIRNNRPKNRKSERHQFENIRSALQKTMENKELPTLLLEDWTNLKHESSEKLENQLEPDSPLDIFYKEEHKNRMVATKQSRDDQQFLEESRLSPGYLNTPKMSRRKRNPRCLRSCLKRGYLHPAQCHMLC